MTRPLSQHVIDAFRAGVEEQGKVETFHGYGPEQGYPFSCGRLCRAITVPSVWSWSWTISLSAIGAKSDVGNISTCLTGTTFVLIPDPVYPVYRDTNQMAGRTITYLNANKENGFLPLPDRTQRADLIYLCSPTTPTGAAYSREQLAEWVAYAREQQAVLLLTPRTKPLYRRMPRSIFEIEGAETCAVEFCSLSKTAGFTGTRCGYTVVPSRPDAGRHVAAQNVAAPPDHQV